MTYTPIPEDSKEYLSQIKRHHDAMIVALQGDNRVPETIRNTAQKLVEGAYYAIETWVRFKVTAVKWKL